MGAGMLVILIITVYLAGAAAAAPRLMRLIYQDFLAEIAEADADYQRQLAAYEKDPKSYSYKPHRIGQRTELDAMREARFRGMWFSAIWPLMLAYFALSGTAFKAEIAAQHAAANAKVIADYDKLMELRFDSEFHSIPTRSGPLRIRRFFKEKH